MNYKELIADAKMQLYDGNYDMALGIVKNAIKIAPEQEDCYLLAGQISISKGNPNGAAQYFSDLVKLNPKGDYYYLLGQAQAMNDDGMNAIANFEKALQKGCLPENKGKIYKIMAMLDVEMGAFDDGLKNIDNASQFIGLDLELLKSRYLCYAGLEDYKMAIASCNQMKLISPSSYEAYSMSFEILMDLELYDEAEKELNRAKRSIHPLPQTYFDDFAKFILVSKTKNEKNNLTDEILKEILSVYSDALNNLYRNSNECDRAFSIILNATQTYLQLKDGKNALRLIDMLWNIPSVFKRKKPIIVTSYKTEDELEELYYSEFFDNLYTQNDGERNADFEKVRESLTPLTDIPHKKKENENDEVVLNVYELDSSQKEIIWGLEISSYELLEDYENMMKSAELLQGANSINARYLGKYTVLKCRKLLKQDKWEVNFNNALGFWRNQRLINPDDILALPYEIRCLIDLGRFEEAEHLIEKLPSQTRQYYLEFLKQEKGDTE